MAHRILLVEDEFDIRDALQMTLEEAGYDVILASNGEEGLKTAIAEQPDLILLDLKMPKMDGHEMLKLLRIDAWGKDAKVIILTSSEDLKHVEQAYQGLVLDYIIKSSMSLEEVEKVVQTVLRGQ